MNQYQEDLAKQYAHRAGVFQAYAELLAEAVEQYDSTDTGSFMKPWRYEEMMRLADKIRQTVKEYGDKPL